MSIISSNYDIIFFGIIGFSAILALIRGAVAEILSLSSWFIAFWVLQRFGPLINNYIPASITNPLARSCLIFLLALIIVSIGIALLKKLCANIISAIGLGSLNYLLGLIFGIIRGILICALLIIIIEILNLDPTHSWQKSRLYPILHPMVAWVIQAIPKHFDAVPQIANHLTQAPQTTQ